MNLFHYYETVTWLSRCLNLIANQGTLSNALSNKEPAGNLDNNDGVDGHILHSSTGPLEGEGVLGEVANSLQHASHISRGHQLNLRQPHKVGHLRLGSPHQHSWGLGNQIQGHCMSLVEVNQAIKAW